MSRALRSTPCVLPDRWLWRTLRLLSNVACDVLPRSAHGCRSVRIGEGEERSGFIVGWQASRSLGSDFAIDAWEVAALKPQPAGNRPVTAGTHARTARRVAPVGDRRGTGRARA